MLFRSSGLEGQKKAYNASQKGTDNGLIKDDFDLEASSKGDNRLIQKLYPYIVKYRNESMATMFHDFETDKNIAADPSLTMAAQKLQTVLGVTRDGLAKQKLDEDAADKASKKGPDAQAPEVSDRADAIKTLAAFKNIPATEETAYANEIAHAATKGDLDKIQARIDADERSGQVHADTIDAQKDARNTAFTNTGLAANDKLLNDPHAGYFGDRKSVV